jgi:cell wall-associated NlpC family hydrolase
LKRFIYFMLLITITQFPLAAESRKTVVKRLFQSIEGWIGTPYVLGGYSKSGIDCSGLTSIVYKEVFGMDLPRRVSQQRNRGKLVKNNFQPGDLIFFKINGSISHVGIYVFDNKFFHAASAGPATGWLKVH